jgi:DNA-binding NtrC family response regulator
MAEKDPEEESSTTVLRPSRGELIQVPSCVLRVEVGPDRGREVIVEGTSIRIGKGSECDFRLHDRAASRAHAAIAPVAGGFAIEDLGSTNGTQVDGVAIRNALLHPGCRISIGATVIRFAPSARSLFAASISADRLHLLNGKSPAMQALYGWIRQVAPTEATVVLLGESGTGKELAARTIHDLSNRAGGPFVVLDCGSLDRELVGSELFGHMKGAFTGAQGNFRGAFERAQGGTLFLDEVGELPLDVQTRLLGVLQRREVRPLGSERALAVNVRVVAATHCNLQQAVARGAFRQDLYYRISVVSLNIPGLSERPGDVRVLAEQLLIELAPAGKPAAPISVAALEELEARPWPGNVRELRNVLERALVQSAGGRIESSHLAPATARAPVRTTGRIRPLVETERQAIHDALMRTGGNKAQAARALGISVSTLKRKLREHGGS